MKPVPITHMVHLGYSGRGCLDAGLVVDIDSGVAASFNDRP